MKHNKSIGGSGLSKSDFDATIKSIEGKVSIVTKKVTIGGVGVAGCDFNFVTAANQTEQPIDTGITIPARARVLDAFTVTEAAFTGAVSLGITIGNATGQNTFKATADMIAANAVGALAHATGFNVAPAVAAFNIWVNGTPGANWSLVTAGKLTLYVTYLDVTDIG